MYKTLIISFVILLQLSFQVQVKAQNQVIVPTKGNSWVVNKAPQTSNILNNNMSGWINKKDVIRTYFYVQKACKLNVEIEAFVGSGSSVICVSSGKLNKQLTINNSTANTFPIGTLEIKNAGYYFIDIQGVSKTSKSFGSVNNILLSGEADKSFIKFVDQDFYFGRRGPSVHLAYELPNNMQDVEWYYNELEVQKGQDVIGSYFMANGFGEGYFGMQVNSSNERRILFSVWSPFHTDDPNSIPEAEKIKLLAKGKKTRTGEFGNEGSGGQSYMIYNWKPNVRYKFLLRGRPEGNNSTTYTAYFFDPEIGEWQLVASFNRPKTNTYLKRFHSFLENFIPDYGAVTRQCGYYNQWVADKEGNWNQVTGATFTYDATAHAQRRFDYAGGVSNKGFFLKMGGFFNENTKFRTALQRPENPQKPMVDFEKLKQLKQ